MLLECTASFPAPFRPAAQVPSKQQLHCDTDVLILQPTVQETARGRRAVEESAGGQSLAAPTHFAAGSVAGVLQERAEVENQYVPDGAG